MQKLHNNIYTANGWQIIEKEYDPDQIIASGSNFMIGNGYLGYRGTFAEADKSEYVACTVTDTWDKAPDSEWRELCTVPNGLLAQVWIDDEMLSVLSGSIEKYHRELDLRHGIYHRSITWSSSKKKKVKYSVKKFASYVNHHLIPMRLSLEAVDDIKLRFVCGIDGNIWSLNGEHFKSYHVEEMDHLISIETVTNEFDIQINVAAGLSIKSGHPSRVSLIKNDRQIFKSLEFNLEQGDQITIEQIAAVCHTNDVQDSRESAYSDIKQALEKGYNCLSSEHKKKWDDIWVNSDICIEGDLEAQTLTRFNIYQATIATPVHARLPIGARGLSCQVYQGAAFWDQETFNLPMFLYTRPEIARSLLEYRYETLPGAKKKAHDLGYYGAFYAWTSGKTGEELFPDKFFTDVLSGRKIRNHFNSWQIHISPDIVYALWTYYEATGDWNFILEYGAEITFEVAQFLVSRIHFKMDRDRYEIIRVLGPDEYHENVDNNAYTNYLVRFSLEKAAYIYFRMLVENPQKLNKLLDKINADHSAINQWIDIESKIYLPQPNDDLIIEQFDGFFKLEDITPARLRERLIDPEEYWGWPNGIAVEAQVLKQADVLQLFTLLDDAFSKKVMRANYDYYEPRTEHGSSLSPSVHALIAAWSGYDKAAYQYFIEAASIDLYHASKKVVSGGSFLGGIHTAAAGAVWQMIVRGFVGFRSRSNQLFFKPNLPKNWKSLSFNLLYKDNKLMIFVDHQIFSITADPKNKEPVSVKIGKNKCQVDPGGNYQTTNY